MPNPPYGVVVYNDNFTRPDGPLASPWVPVTNYYSGSGVHQLPTLKSNGWTVLTGTSGVGNSSGVYNASLPNDQWAEAVFTAVGAPTTDTELGVCVRMSLDGQNGYFILAGPNVAFTKYAVEFWKIVAGAYTQLGQNTPSLISIGDSFGVEAIGNNIIFRYNGAIVGAFVDNDLSSGFAGVFAGTAQGSSSTQDTIASSWQAGSVDMPGFTQLATDAFQRADENPLSDGGNWSTTTIGIIVPAQLVSHQAIAAIGGFNGDAVWTGIIWPNDQYSEITIANLVDSGDFVGVSVRSSSSVDTRYTVVAQGPFGAGAGNIYLVSRIAGVQTILGDILNTTISINDVIRLAIKGSNLTVYQNGISVLTAIDASIASGSAALLAQYDFSTPGNGAISLWAGGTFSPVPTSITPTNGLQGATISNFTVNGSNFGTSGTISFSGTGITVNSYSSQTDTQIVASITISGVAVTTARDVIVTNPTNASTTGTLAAAFTVIAPVITGGPIALQSGVRKVAVFAFNSDGTLSPVTTI